jgi:hypothetical protein
MQQGRSIGCHRHQSKDKPIKCCRGEGGEERRGGPLWSPAVRVDATGPEQVIEGGRATMKALPTSIPPPSPLRNPGRVSCGNAYWVYGLPTSSVVKATTSCSKRAEKTRFKHCTLALRCGDPHGLTMWVIHTPIGGRLRRPYGKLGGFSTSLIPSAGDHKGPHPSPHHSRPYGSSVAFLLLPPILPSLDASWAGLATALG